MGLFSLIEKEIENRQKLAKTEKYTVNDVITNISNIMKVFNAEFCDKDKQYQFEERAAIMEFDGGLSRSEAEKKALEEVVNVYNI
jgi:hypothetical protein